MSFAALLAWAKGLSVFSKVMGGVGTIAGLGFLGPFGAVFGFLLKAAKTLISWLWEALELTLTHPVIFTLLLTAFFAGSAVRGSWDKHRVESYKIEAQNIVSKVKGAADVEKQKAQAAIAARDAAKTISLFEPQQNVQGALVLSVPPPARPGAVVAAKPAANPDGGLRKPGKGVRDRPKCDAVFCF